MGSLRDRFPRDDTSLLQMAGVFSANEYDDQVSSYGHEEIKVSYFLMLSVSAKL